MSITLSVKLNALYPYCYASISFMLQRLICPLVMRRCLRNMMRSLRARLCFVYLYSASPSLSPPSFSPWLSLTFDSISVHTTGTSSYHLLSAARTLNQTLQTCLQRGMMPQGLRYDSSRTNTALSTCLLTGKSQLLIAVLKTSVGKLDYKAISEFMGPGKSRLVLTIQLKGWLKQSARLQCQVHPIPDLGDQNQDSRRQGVCL